jgi:hypothetical protein
MVMITYAKMLVSYCISPFTYITYIQSKKCIYYIYLYCSFNFQATCNYMATFTCNMSGQLFQFAVSKHKIEHDLIKTELQNAITYISFKNNKKYRECSCLQTVSEISGPVLLSILNRFVVEKGMSIFMDVIDSTWYSDSNIARKCPAESWRI